MEKRTQQKKELPGWYLVVKNSTAIMIFIIKGQTICSHLYEITELPGLNASFLWMMYKVCCEIFVRLGPTVLLISMNVAIIRNFNLSVRRKKKLRASKFIEKNFPTSHLFPSGMYNFWYTVPAPIKDTASIQKVIFHSYTPVRFCQISSIFTICNCTKFNKMHQCLVNL